MPDPGVGSDRGKDPASELDCLRGILPVPLLHAAERRSRELNLGADQVLIQWGVISEETYVAHLARHLGIGFDDLSTVGRAHCPLADADLPGIAEFGILPLQEDDTLNWIVTPRAFTARRLMRFSTTYPSLIARIRLTTRRHLHQYLTEQTGDALSDIAAEGLLRTRPAMSAKSIIGWRRGLQPAILLLVCAVLALLYPTLAMDLIGGLAAIWFLAFSLLRLTCVLVPPQPEQRFPPLRGDQLPIYSVVVALYREETSVPGLLRSLQRLDYPSEKLDIILVLEPDDLRTRAAVARARPGPQVQVLIAQATGPKTKPKALNVALPFVRGSFLTVFDAEDDPDPGQLRAALGMFRQHNDDVACVQAGLHFDNLTHSLLSRMAAVEYAGLFAVFLPGLVALGMPLPLGGTSNHFRTDTLRRIGGWDAYNVTEDADLGIRLARLGYRSVTIPSVTLEEAPIAFGAWLRQRSRWMKGWMHLLSTSNNCSDFMELRLDHSLGRLASQHHRNRLAQSAKPIVGAEPRSFWTPVIKRRAPARKTSALAWLFRPHVVENKRESIAGLALKHPDGRAIRRRLRRSMAGGALRQTSGQCLRKAGGQHRASLTEAHRKLDKGPCTEA